MEVVRDQAAREEPRQREHVAVGEVDQLQDPVDERVAERDQRVDRALRSPIRKMVKKSAGLWTRL